MPGDPSAAREEPEQASWQLDEPITQGSRTPWDDTGPQQECAGDLTEEAGAREGQPLGLGEDARREAWGKARLRACLWGRRCGDPRPWEPRAPPGALPLLVPLRSHARHW